VSFQAQARDAFSEQMFALIGLKGRQLRTAAQLDCKRLLPYLGLLSLRAHSAAVIETVLRYYFKHDRVFIEQWVERSVVITPAQLNQLGVANSVLGTDQVLGDRVADCSGKFRVHVQGLDWQQFHGFLPTGADYPLLCALVRLTARDPLDYDLRLVLDKESIRPLHVGEYNFCRLGWTSWLAHECADGVVIVANNAH